MTIASGLRLGIGLLACVEAIIQYRRWFRDRDSEPPIYGIFGPTEWKVLVSVSYLMSATWLIATSLLLLLGPRGAWYACLCLAAAHLVAQVSILRWLLPGGRNTPVGTSDTVVQDIAGAQQRLDQVRGFWNRGDKARALEELEIALNNHPSSWLLHYGAFHLFGQAGNEARSILELATALVIQPTNPTTIKRLAGLLRSHDLNPAADQLLDIGWQHYETALRKLRATGDNPPKISREEYETGDGGHRVESS